MVWEIVRTSKMRHGPDSDLRPRVNDAKQATQPLTPPPTPKCDKCMISQILRNNDPSTPLVNSGCTQDGFYRIPLADGDGLDPGRRKPAPAPVQTGGYCALCENILDSTNNTFDNALVRRRTVSDLAFPIIPLRAQSMTAWSTDGVG